MARPKSSTGAGAGAEARARARARVKHSTVDEHIPNYEADAITTRNLQANANTLPPPMSTPNLKQEECTETLLEWEPGLQARTLDTVRFGVT